MRAFPRACLFIYLFNAFHFVQTANCKHLKLAKKNPVNSRPFFKADAFNVVTYFYKSSCFSEICLFVRVFLLYFFFNSVYFPELEEV